MADLIIQCRLVLEMEDETAALLIRKHRNQMKINSLLIELDAPNDEQRRAS